MPQTVTDLSPREIAVFTQSYAPLGSGHERIVEGDIVCVRKPSLGIGSSEAARHIWMRVEGLDTYELGKYNHYLTDPLDEELEQPSGPRNRFDKRRFCIPLERLNEIAPFFDINRAKDPQDIYQPFLPVDEDTFLFLAARQPLWVEGLVFDKSAGRYI